MGFTRDIPGKFPYLYLPIIGISTTFFIAFSTVWVFQLPPSVGERIYIAFISFGDILASSICSPSILGGCSPLLSGASWQTPSARQTVGVGAALLFSLLLLGKLPLLANAVGVVAISFSKASWLSSAARLTVEVGALYYCLKARFFTPLLAGGWISFLFVWLLVGPEYLLSTQ